MKIREDFRKSELFILISMFLVIGLAIQGLSKKIEADNIEEEVPEEEVIRDNNPPIIILSEKDEDYRFALSKAEVPNKFREALLRQIIPLLDQLATQYECNSIEIIGHCDHTVYNSSIRNNMDEQLIESVNKGNLDNLKPSSNLGLGMLRALSVRQIMVNSKKAGYLLHINSIRAYSAGQLIDLNNQISTERAKKECPSLRRIEIRLMRYDTRDIATIAISD